MKINKNIIDVYEKLLLSILKDASKWKEGYYSYYSEFFNDDKDTRFEIMINKFNIKIIIGNANYNTEHYSYNVNLIKKQKYI